MLGKTTVLTRIKSKHDSEFSSQYNSCILAEGEVMVWGDVKCGGDI